MCFIIFIIITSGHYAVTNVISFGLHSGMKTTLATPLIQDTNICLEFWYNQPTSSSNLQVMLYQYKNITTIWSGKGPNGIVWKKLQLSIQSEHPFKVSLMIVILLNASLKEPLHAFLSLFFLPLCCLFFTDLRILITHWYLHTRLENIVYTSK